MNALHGRIIVTSAICAISAVVMAGCPQQRTFLRVDNDTLLGVTSVHLVETGSDAWGKPDIKSISPGESARAVVKGDIVDVLVQFASPQPDAEPDKGDCEEIFTTSLEIYGWDPTEPMHVLALSQADACTDVYYQFDPEDNN
jgi:hypothetical protein